MEQLHSVAVAVGALITAFLLAFLVVMLCHCRSTRRWAFIKERCKALVGRPTSADTQPIVDVSSLQRPRLSPEVIYFTANEPVLGSADDAESVSQLTGKLLSYRRKGQGMAHFRI